MLIPFYITSSNNHIKLRKFNNKCVKMIGVPMNSYEFGFSFARDRLISHVFKLAANTPCCDVARWPATVRSLSKTFLLRCDSHCLMMYIKIYSNLIFINIFNIF